MSPATSSEAEQVRSSDSGGSLKEWRRVVDAPRRIIETHPLLCVAAVAICVAMGHAIWIWTHRRVGALDPDEAGYIAAALRLQRSIDPLHPLEFVRTAMSGGNGPLVPFLAVPLLLVGPRDPRTVMMLQPILMVVTCVAIGGITRRMAGPIAAFATGTAFLALPTVSLATQSFWLGLGATTFMALAVWALFSSDALTNRWTYAFGASIGCMALSRTMAIAFVPGLVVAGAVIAGNKRASWWGLVRAVACALLVAGPWYFLQRSSIFGYLLDYGYGDRAGLFGSGGPIDRLGFRYERISGDIGTSLTFTVLLAALVTIPPALWRCWKDRQPPSSAPEFLAIALAVALGLAALVSTSNSGVWFELPLIALMVAGAGALMARAWLPIRLALVIQLCGQGVIILLVTWWLVAPRLGMTAHYEHGFAQYDERYEQGRRDEQPLAAADWRRLSQQTVNELKSIDGGTGYDTTFTVSGNMQLFNSNTLALAGEQTGWGLAIRIPDTTMGQKDRSRELTPTTVGPDGRTVERVLVVALHDQHLFTPDENVQAFARQARRAGWRETSTIPMPDGGTVLIMRHPDRSA